MVIVTRAVVGFAAVGGGFQFVGQRGGPLFPGEMALLRKLDREREGLRLPRFGKDGSALIARQCGRAQRSARE